MQQLQPNVKQVPASSCYPRGFSLLDAVELDRGARPCRGVLIQKHAELASFLNLIQKRGSGGKGRAGSQRLA